MLQLDKRDIIGLPGLAGLSLILFLWFSGMADLEDFMPEELQKSEMDRKQIEELGDKFLKGDLD